MEDPRWTVIKEAISDFWQLFLLDPHANFRSYCEYKDETDPRFPTGFLDGFLVLYNTTRGINVSSDPGLDVLRLPVPWTREGDPLYQLPRSLMNDHFHSYKEKIKKNEREQRRKEKEAEKKKEKEQEQVIEQVTSDEMERNLARMRKNKSNADQQKADTNKEKMADRRPDRMLAKEEAKAKNLAGQTKNSLKKN